MIGFKAIEITKLLWSLHISTQETPYVNRYYLLSKMNTTSMAAVHITFRHSNTHFCVGSTFWLLDPGFSYGNHLNPYKLLMVVDIIPILQIRKPRVREVK